jgi:hypothetical protein
LQKHWVFPSLFLLLGSLKSWQFSCNFIKWSERRKGGGTHEKYEQEKEREEEMRKRALGGCHKMHGGIHHQCDSTPIPKCGNVKENLPQNEIIPEMQQCGN